MYGPGKVLCTCTITMKTAPEPWSRYNACHIKGFTLAIGGGFCFVMFLLLLFQNWVFFLYCLVYCDSFLIHIPPNWSNNEHYLRECSLLCIFTDIVQSLSSLIVLYKPTETVSRAIFYPLFLLLEHLFSVSLFSSYFLHFLKSSFAYYIKIQSYCKNTFKIFSINGSRIWAL